MKTTHNKLPKLSKIIGQIENPILKEICLTAFSDPDFLVSPASCRKHQPYKSGLVDHVFEVLEIALQIAECKELRVNRDVLITAVIWHDYGKIWDYKLNPNMADPFPGSCKPKLIDPSDPEYIYTRHRWTVRHVARSYHEFMSVAKKAKLDENLAEEIGHAILAHHGRTDWGSPVEPLTVEAYIVQIISRHGFLASRIYFIRPEPIGLR